MNGYQSRQCVPEAVCCDPSQALRRGVAWGQEQFQLLLEESETSEAGSEAAEDVCLEDLRYRWMLHKSKLKDLTNVRARTKAKVRGAILNGLQLEMYVILF